MEVVESPSCAVALIGGETIKAQKVRVTIVIVMPARAFLIIRMCISPSNVV